MSDTSDLLGSLPLFETLNTRELAELVAVAVPRSFDRGEVIFQEGTQGDVMYVIRKGRILIKREHAGGRTIALTEMGPGDLFGELAIFDKEARSATAECIEKTKVVALTSGDVSRVLTRNPEIAVKLLQQLSRRIRAANSRIGDQYFQSTEGRIVNVVLGLAEQQNGNVMAGSFVRANQSEIAQLASTSRETVSRFLANCQRADLLTTYRGRLQLRDPEGMRRMVV
ncbi:MAG: Crp/Fnr family transcriptional regulator [Solirubrobacterales bacterium]|nr:Crp/Fnr family transcriptional regulator [Solirubrobacterales bacterium]